MNGTALTIVVLGTLVFAAHVFTEIFSRKRIPDLLLLLIIGIVIGPVLKLVSTDNFGEIGSIFTTITLIIILFEGGSELTFKNIQSTFKEMIYLTLASYFAIMIVLGLLGHFVLHIPIMSSFFMGAVLGGAAEAIVIPLTKQLNLSEKSKATLVLETSFSTVICFIVSLALYQAILADNFEIGKTLGNIVSSFTLAAILGFGGAIFWAIILQRVRTVKNSTFTTPAFVFIVYGINALLGYSGEIAALTFGITLANIDSVYNSIFKKLFPQKPDTLNYNEKMLFSEMAFLLRTFVFVYIGISIKLTDLKSIIIGVCISFILLIIRIFVVRYSIAKPNKEISKLETMYMSCLVPKGLAAAILATMLVQANHPEGEMIKNIVYSVIFFSIILTCVAIPVVEKSKGFQNVLSKILYFSFSSKKKEEEKIVDDDNKTDEPVTESATETIDK